MSDVSEHAIVRLIVADYAAADQAGKLNLIGGALSIIPTVGDTGTGMTHGNTLPFTVVASISVGPRLHGAECALEVLLEDEHGKQVWVPEQGGESSALRIGHPLVFEKPTFLPGSGAPAAKMRARAQLVLNFAAGLPLAPGVRYKWRVRIDHETREEWTEEFFVPHPPGRVVVG